MPESAKESRSYGMSDSISNPNQEKAIMHTVGAAQVFAGPGSGKTYVTVQRIKQLITKQGVDPSHILVITFTKAAAQEMQERFFRLMEPDRPPVKFGTFHAVFYHILKQSAQYRDYSIITEAEKRKLIRQIIHMHKRFIRLQEEDMDELLRILNLYKNTSAIKQMSVQEITSDDILFLAEEYEKYLNEFKQMDFDDIIRYCHILLTEYPQILSRWQQQFEYILIDEFQDISPNQYNIIKLLAAPQNNLFIVGDDDQSIYGFRGASPDSMQQFMRDYPEAVRIFLDINYRCNRQITDASLKMIEENHNRVGKKIRAAHNGDVGFDCTVFESESEEAEFLLSKLHQKHRDGELSRCAMICRTNYECALWAQNLHKKGIPFMMKEAPQNRFQHFVVQDIMAYLAMADGNMCRKHFLRIMNRPVRYIRRDSVPEEYVSESKLLQYYAGTPVIQEQVSKLFRELRSLKSKKLDLQIHYIRKVIGYDKYLVEKYGMERGEELIGTAIEFQQFAKDFRTLAEVNDYISQYEKMLLSQREIETCKKNPGQEASTVENKEGLWLITMHASKGLEFDTVYVPGCMEGKIPSSKSQTEEEIEEERRMFYVAMTRARQELWITAYKGKTGKDIPSRFLGCFSQSFPSINSSNSAESKYSSKASATASYSSSSSM
ncbi:MAG: ATP-dependent helicase [Lachnospiraceae bacterium]|nr:ATP-dependent helicase [Lachnospiraceae bacterium]